MLTINQSYVFTRAKKVPEKPKDSSFPDYFMSIKTAQNFTLLTKLVCPSSTIKNILCSS